MSVGAEMRSRQVDANGISVRYLESGPPDARHPLLFLHGGTGTAERHWSAQLEDLGTLGYRCLAPDHRGHGGTANDRDGLDQGLMAEDQSAFLRRLGVERAHVVGFSIGGVIALYLALAHPDQVASITAIGSHMTIDEHVLASNATVEPSTIEREAPDWAAQLTELHGVHYGADHWRALCGWLIETWGRQPDWSEADLGQVNARALIGRGEFDDRVTQAQVDRMAAAIPDARTFVVGGVGHFFHHSGTGREALHRELTGFLPQP
ncbi:alpha/beta hydrolase [soil metagenome]